MTKLSLRISFVLGLAMLFGCSSVDLERVVTAKGVLTYQGKALANYKVTFEPLDNRQAASAITDAEGRFELGTNAPGDGAAPGKHRVAVSFVSEKIEGEPGKEIVTQVKPSVKIPEKYASRDTSGIEIEVPPGGSEALEIKLD